MKNHLSITEMARHLNVWNKASAIHTETVNATGARAVSTRRRRHVVAVGSRTRHVACVRGAAQRPRTPDAC
eukprot:6209796-Pleurochrysis_carterae.AAC.2